MLALIYQNSFATYNCPTFCIQTKRRRASRPCFKITPAHDFTRIYYSLDAAAICSDPLFFSETHSINNNHHQREHFESSVCTDTPIYRKENGIAALPVMVSLVPFRIIIGWPSSLLQVIRGGGWPVARHHRVAFSPSDTERSPLVSSYTISGGTGTGKHSLQNKTVAFRVTSI